MMRVSRRKLLLSLPPALPLILPLALAACATETVVVQTSFEPLNFDYLAKLRMSVGSIDIDDGWRPGPGSRDVGYLSPVVPVVALRQMAEQRLLPGGTTGRGVFVIDQASLVAAQGNFTGIFAVHLDVLDEAGNRAGYAEARVARSATAHDETPARMRAGLYQLTRQLMGDMNVELEFQVRRSLKGYLQATSTAPVPGRVETQDLPPL